MNNLFDQFCFFVPLEKFVFKVGDKWAFSEAVGREGIMHYILDAGRPLHEVKEILEEKSYMRAYGAEVVPGATPIVVRTEDERPIINLWVPPTLQPKPGEYPRLQRVFEWLTDNDKEGERWLKHWMAWKVQDPAVCPKVAVVITTVQGGGKGTLAAAMAQMLGPENCETIKREQLENRFNGRWIQKLFVLADEILSGDDTKDITASLKVYIDGNTVELEKKNRDQKSVRNRLAWMFASNDPVSPILIEEHDRRYTIFSNHKVLPEDYRRMFLSMFTGDRSKPTPDFLDEIAALNYELLSLKVDKDWVSKPYDNATRRSLIAMSRPSYEAFFDAIAERGFDEVLAEVTYNAMHLSGRRDEWYFAEPPNVAVSSAMFYQIYSEFCKQSGSRPVRRNKLARAIKHLQPGWESIQLTRKVGDVVVRPRCYRLPGLTTTNESLN